MWFFTADSLQNICVWCCRNFLSKKGCDFYSKSRCMPSEYWDRASSMELSTNCTERWTTFLVITSLLFRRKLLAPYKRDIITTCWETPNSQGHTKMRTEHNQWFRWGGGAMHRRSGFSAPITSTLTDLSNFIKCNFGVVTCWSLHTSSSLRAQILPAGCQSNKQFLLVGRRIHCWVRHFFWLHLHVSVENLT